MQAQNVNVHRQWNSISQDVPVDPSTEYPTYETKVHKVEHTADKTLNVVLRKIHCYTVTRMSFRIPATTIFQLSGLKEHRIKYLAQEQYISGNQAPDLIIMS